MIAGRSDELLEVSFDAGLEAGNFSDRRSRALSDLLQQKSLGHRVVAHAVVSLLRQGHAHSVDISIARLLGQLPRTYVRMRIISMTIVCPRCRQPLPSSDELIEAKVAELIKRCDKHDIVVPDDGYLDEHDAATTLRLSWDRLRALRYEGKFPNFRRASRRRVEHSLSDLAVFEIDRDADEIA